MAVNDKAAYVYDRTARAHAKVNLQLGVGAARPDGFHELVSVFQALNIYDEVTLRAVPAASPVLPAAPTPAALPRMASLRAQGPYAAGVPEDSTNLAWRAVEAVAQEYAGRSVGPTSDERATDAPTAQAVELELILHKGIPAAGGMAGGSADAAAALRLAADFFAQYVGKSVVDEARLMELAAELGSDVPFTLLGGTALGTGRGEKLTRMLARGTFHWAIITSDKGLSTPEVFGTFDRLHPDTDQWEPAFDSTAVATAVAAGDVHHLAAALVNDLQAPALSLRPDLRKTLRAGEAAGALRGIVSGSGPTCAFLCADADVAAEVVAEVTVEIPGARGIVTTSPAPGATLLP